MPPPFDPNPTVYCCPHWQTTCRDQTPPEFPYWDRLEPPLCHNRHVMDVPVKLREWEAGTGWPR